MTSLQRSREDAKEGEGCHMKKRQPLFLHSSVQSTCLPVLQAVANSEISKLGREEASTPSGAQMASWLRTEQTPPSFVTCLLPVTNYLRKEVYSDSRWPWQGRHRSERRWLSQFPVRKQREMTVHAQPTFSHFFINPKSQSTEWNN